VKQTLSLKIGDNKINAETRLYCKPKLDDMVYFDFLLKDVIGLISTPDKHSNYEWKSNSTNRKALTSLFFVLLINR
jgi:hypothetical protein